jgi:hypothetical protein
MNIIQGVAVECDDTHIADRMTRIEYKETNLRDIDNKIPFSTSLYFKKKVPLQSSIPGLQYIPVVVMRN